MSLAALFGISIVGTVFWVVSPEAAAAFEATQGRWPPLDIAAAAASGQLVAQALLYAFGHALRRRWPWFDRQCERLRARLGSRLRRGDKAVVLASALVGLPPTSTVATLAPALGLRARAVLPLLFAGRVARFAVVAAIAARAVQR
jgi:membrane protein YqaA with SNARE-associated domain